MAVLVAAAVVPSREGICKVLPNSSNINRGVLLNNMCNSNGFKTN